jgi:hypothetical protein
MGTILVDNKVLFSWVKKIFKKKHQISDN